MRKEWKDLELAEYHYTTSSRNDAVCYVSKCGRVFLDEREVEYIRNGKMYIRKYEAKEMSYNNMRGNYKICAAGIVHRLVAQCFVPNPYKLSTVNHKDGNKQNNHADNLEWMTQKQNVRHYYNSDRAIDVRKWAVELFYNGSSVGVFPSQLDAARYIGIKKNTFHYLITGKHKTSAGGYTANRITKEEYHAKKAQASL